MKKGPLDDKAEAEDQSTLRRVVKQIVAGVRSTVKPAPDGRAAKEGAFSAVAEKAVEERLETSQLLDAIMKTIENAQARIRNDKLRSWEYREKFEYAKNRRASSSAQGSAPSGDAQAEATIKLDSGWALLPKTKVGIHPARGASKEISFPSLSHGLEAVVSRQGVVPVYDNRRKRFNFEKDLYILHDPGKVRREVFPKYTTPSRDVQLKYLARKQKKPVKFRSSTSAMTGVLSLLYHIVSNYRPTTLSGLSKAFADKRNGFTKHAYAPIALVMHKQHKKSGSCAVDKVDNFKDNVLSQIGTHIETLLTVDTATFRQAALTESTLNAKHAREKLPKQAYNFSTVGVFLVRAQIDCHRQGQKDLEFFEIKTRAVAPMRYKLSEFYKYVNYRINKAKGIDRSFELEFYDMVRSTFLKYILQIRLGRMRGAFVCFHNTREIFGFEYYTVEEMEKYVFGSSFWAGKAFAQSIKLLELILDAARKEFPEDRKYRLKLLFQLSDDCGVHVFVYRLFRDEDPMESIISSGAFMSTRDIVKKLRDARLSKKNLVQFRLEVKTFVNGAGSGGQVTAAPGDDVRVAYTLDRVPNVDYQRLRDVARLVDIDDEFDVRHLPQPAKQFFTKNVPEVLAKIIRAGSDLDSVQESSTTSPKD